MQSTLISLKPKSSEVFRGPVKSICRRTVFYRNGQIDRTKSLNIQGGPKSDTFRTLHYIVREVSLFWPTLYNFISPSKNGSQEKKQKYVQYSQNKLIIQQISDGMVVVRRTVADPKFLKMIVN